MGDVIWVRARVSIVRIRQWMFAQVWVGVRVRVRVRVRRGVRVSQVNLSVLTCIHILLLTGDSKNEVGKREQMECKSDACKSGCALQRGRPRDGHSDRSRDTIGRLFTCSPSHKPSPSPWP